MPREGLPFETVEEPKHLASKTVADVFEFTPEKEKKYVYKEVRSGTRIFKQYRGKNLTETAALMNKTYQILKRHLGDYLVPTHFMIAKNKRGKPCIMMAQEKIEGKLAREIIESRPFGEGWPLDIEEQAVEMMQLSREAEEDPELLELIEEGKLSLETTDFFFFEETSYWENIIVDKSGRVRVVDW